jgi:hypothetical protein
MLERNIFLYWVNKEYELISILRNLIYLHSTNGKGYKVHLITDKNVKDYIKVIPEYFSKLFPAYQADFVRVNVICDYGGIWLDSDTLVMSSLDSLFDIFEIFDGFFIRQNNEELSNGIFGSKANTPLLLEWKKHMMYKLDSTNGQIGWTEIGNLMLEALKKTNPNFYNNYKIFDGLDNMYPVNWNKCVDEFLLKPYDNYKLIVREFQPLIVLVNSVYKNLEGRTEAEILQGKMPLNYFLNKSIENAGLNTEQRAIQFSSLFTNNSKNKQIFETIYAKNIWNNNDPNVPLSGPGSSLENTKDVSVLLNSFIYNNNCKKILDLGCGDLTWMSKTPFFNDMTIKYTGVDIVESQINNHRSYYPQNTFVCEDLITYHDIEPASLIIIRDVLFHLTNDDILSIFRNIRNKFDFIAITSCKNEENTDNFNQWHFAEKNIHKPPFNRSNYALHKIHEHTFNRFFYIFSHEQFYQLSK